MNILRANQAYTHTDGDGKFRLDIIRPGLIYQDIDREDYAFGPLSRIDHAYMSKRILVDMHQHTNDEIFSYLYRGEMFHRDSAGTAETVSPQRLMFMNAGKSFYHEEATPDMPVEMLQIFIRPNEKDLEPDIQFADRTIERDSQWHMLAAPANMNAPLTIRQNTVVYDVHTEKGTTLDLPKIEGMAPWLYVVDGVIKVGDDLLTKGDAITGDMAELITVDAVANSTLVLFLVDLAADMTYAGNYSGHKH